MPPAYRWLMTSGRPARPIYWRVCNLQQNTEVSGIRLDAGWWALAFPDRPAQSQKLFASMTEVDDPAGAVLFVRVLTAPNIADLSPSSYRHATVFMIAKELEAWGLEQLGWDDPDPSTATS